MAVIYDAATKAARMTATRDMVAGGTLELMSAADQVLAIFTLTATGGGIAGAVWTLEFVAAEVNGLAAAGAGTSAAKARVKDSSGTARITGLTVGLPSSSADIKLVNVSITENQPVTLTAATFTHAPDPS